jgi:SSS family solute:Na+ symporter
VTARYIILFLAYSAAVLAAGLAFSRKMKNLEDFFLASKNLPGSLIFVSLTASWFGASSILVSTDEALKTGLSAFWIIGGPAVLTILILSVFFSGPLRRLPNLSLPDLFELRYGRIVRHLASALIIWYMVMLAASQMVALGQFLKIFLGLSYLACLAVGTVIVLVYSVTGGLRSVVFTDIVQFVLLTAGIFGLAVFLGWRTSFAEVGRLAAQTREAGFFGFFHNWEENALIVLSFTLAWTISPIAIQRIQSARNARAARRGLRAAAVALFFLYGSVVFVGIFSLPLFPRGGLSGPMISEIIASKTEYWLSGLLFVAVLAAILSTMDTAINTGALSLARDVHEQLFPSSGMSRVRISRFATATSGILAFLIATRFQSILKTIGLSSEIMAEGLFVPGVAMIFWRRRMPLAGFLSLCLGGGFALVSFLVASRLIALPFPVWPYSLPYGLGLSFGGFLAGAALEVLKKRP